jgi:magnesium transporter
MNQTQTLQATKSTADQEFFLSEFLGAKVIVGGKKVGKLSDVVIKENGTLPVVTHFFVSMPFGVKAVVPWEKVSEAGPKGIILCESDISPYKGEPAENAVLLKDHVLDKEIIDLDGQGLEVAYDIKLAQKNNKLYVSEVDLSKYGMLRRLKLIGLANFIYNLAESIREQTISWSLVQPLPEDLGRFHGTLKLNVLKEKLADMHPVDIADILEEVDHDQRVQLFKELDPEQASDTLEEISPNVQRDLVSSLSKEKVALLIDDMTPGQAADVLSVLPAADAEDIIELLGEENAAKVKAIIEHQEENILDFATQDFLAFNPDETSEQVIDEYRSAARGKDVVMYLYVVDEAMHLLGVADIKDVLKADESTPLKDIMTESVIDLDADSTLKEASTMFTRYNFRAIPVIDGENKILGVVPYRDIVGLKHHFVG